jgi:hypothetical protein
VLSLENFDRLALLAAVLSSLFLLLFSSANQQTLVHLLSRALLAAQQNHLISVVVFHFFHCKGVFLESDHFSRTALAYFGINKKQDEDAEVTTFVEKGKQ